MERTLEILDDEKKTGSLIDDPAAKEKAVMKSLVMIFVVGAVMAVLAAGYLLQHALQAGDSYKKGFNDGVASMSAGLAAAQKQSSAQTQRIDQLQGDFAKANGSVLQLQHEMDQTRQNLSVVTRQREQAQQNLKDLRQTLGNKVAAVKRGYDKRFKKVLKIPAQKKIQELNDQLSAAQKDLGAKEQQLASAKSDIEQKQGQINQLQQAMRDLRAARSNEKFADWSAMKENFHPGGSP